jgi:tRNA A-37 threonylcarbamoyl transferase component Bud32
MNSWDGRTLGKVQIDSLLARGGMAEVYLGTHTTLQREVVVKILRGHYEEDPSLLERFQREARVVAKLRHPNIVQVFDFDTVDDQPYIVMEYIAGPSLSRYLKALHAKNRRLELPLVSRLLTGVASALQYAHDSRVIHRDVKPGNIILSSRSSQIVPGEPLPADFEPILTDFGLVRILSMSEQTTVGRIAGTPAYMSPEQARGEQTDERTDIYSLGIVLYQLLAGHVPFDGESTMSILLKHVNEPPAPILGLSAPLQDVLDRALAKNATDRFQSPKEFAAVFNAVMEERSEASTVKRATPITISSAKKTRDRTQLRVKWIPAILAGIAIIAVAAFFLLNGFAASGNNTPTAAITLTPTIATPVGLVSSPLGPTGLLRFQDGTAIMDKATLTALAMPAPPAGSQYEVWLVGSSSGERRSLGILMLDENGRGTLTFDDSRDQNLLAIYDKVEVTIKPNTDAGTDGFQQVAYAYTLPESGLEYIRRLLVSSPLAPDQVALIQGLSANTKLIEQTAREMLSAYENGEEADTRESAEGIINLLAGSRSREHKDWNGDGQITDPSDGYGLWLNGDNLGYIQAVYSHADYAANSPGASQNMIVNGGRVKSCAENLAQWVPQLRERALTILSATSFSDMDRPVRDSVALADQMLNGVDQDKNGTIEPASGECGALTAYQYTYYMADMPLLPVNPLDTPTATGTPSPTATNSTFIIRPTNTLTRSPGTSLNTSIPPTNKPPDNPPTDPPGNPRPTQKPKKPTNTPKPPDPPGGPQPTKTK